MRQCDLVPPLRGVLKNFSIVLAAGEMGRPTKVQTFNDTPELDGPLAKQTRPLLDGFERPRLKKPAVAGRLSDLLPFLPKGNHRFDAATCSAPAMEIVGPINGHSGWIP